MTSPDWARLEPHRPVEPGDGRYVPRPSQAGAEIAAWTRAGCATVLVVGPVGVGKSSELAAACEALRAERVVVWAPIDRVANLRSLRGEHLLFHLTSALAQAVVAQDLSISPAMADNLRLRDLWGQVEGWTAHASTPRLDGLDLLVALAREAAGATRSGRVCFVIDGLEKLPEAASEALDALRGLPVEIDLISTIPWHAAFTLADDELVRGGERLFSVRPIPILHTRDPEALFWTQLAKSRLQVAMSSPEGTSWLAKAAAHSGGVPRVFLQLLADAGTYVRLRGVTPFAPEAMAAAIADLRASFVRALLPGDLDAMARIAGTDGVELERGRKVRLLARGLLLEQPDGSLRPHPLLGNRVKVSAA